MVTDKLIILHMALSLEWFTRQTLSSIPHLERREPCYSLSSLRIKSYIIVHIRADMKFTGRVVLRVTRTALPTSLSSKADEGAGRSKNTEPELSDFPSSERNPRAFYHTPSFSFARRAGGADDCVRDDLLLLGAGRERDRQLSRA